MMFCLGSRFDFSRCWSHLQRCAQLGSTEKSTLYSNELHSFQSFQNQLQNQLRSQNNLQTQFQSSLTTATSFEAALKKLAIRVLFSEV